METQLFVGIPEKRKIKFKTELAKRKHTARNIVNIGVLEYLATSKKSKWSKKA